MYGNYACYPIDKQLICRSFKFERGVLDVGFAMTTETRAAFFNVPPIWKGLRMSESRRTSFDTCQYFATEKKTVSVKPLHHVTYVLVDTVYARCSCKNVVVLLYIHLLYIQYRRALNDSYFEWANLDKLPLDHKFHLTFMKQISHTCLQNMLKKGLYERSRGITSMNRVKIRQEMYE